jgi:16S rRNA (uracil1498-N3)-methyltransferase
MRRFFFQREQRQGNIVTLSRSESRHICRVLRLGEGQSVELVDGSGVVYSAVISEAGEPVRLAVQEGHLQPQSAGTELLVGVGAIKVKKIELLLQKCTELGVTGFYPFVGSRSQGNLIRQYGGKDERWRRIIEEACKQSLRPRSMDLYEMVSFAELIALPEVQRSAARLLFWEKERDTSLAAWQVEPMPGNTVMLLFGPEGGFTEQEVTDAVRAGWRTVGLGKRILRAETAVIAAVSIVQHHLGNM